MSITKLRRGYHAEICKRVFGLNKDGVPNIADVTNKGSIAIARGILDRFGFPPCGSPPAGQTTGTVFGKLTMEFLNRSFKLLEHLRPGDWIFSASQAGSGITAFDQYEHIARLSEIAKKDKELAIILGEDYLITPDIVIGRKPVSDRAINEHGKVVDKDVATLTTFRESNSVGKKPILHASISCKWTIRSDRAQNTRTEALNLIRNRKGKTPHIVAVTAEPLPTRIASLAMGTGDIDCVYHMALLELREVVKEISNYDQGDMLETLIHGKRLRDISDLPFDLVT
jgi:hypothetical protein